MTEAANDANIHRDPFGPDVKVCRHHYDRMRAAIQSVGLWHRVSRSPEHLKARAERFDPYDVDPLHLLHSMVFGKCRHVAAINSVELTDRCPVCVFEVGHWIDDAAISVSKRLAKLDEEKLADIAHNEELNKRDRG